MSRKLGFALSAALVATVVVTTPAHASVTITDLGGLPGSAFHSAASINDAGVAVGRSRSTSLPERAVRYGGSAAELVGPAGASTSVTSVNSSGAASGTTFDPFVSGRAIRFDPDGSHRVLDSYPGYEFASGQAIDDSGTVYGIVLNSSSSQLPVKWDLNGALTLLALPDGMTWAVVTGASNGYAVGYVTATGRHVQAMRWNPAGTVTRLAGLANRAESYARAVNRHGEVVGEAYTENNFAVVGVRWDITGSVITTYGGNTHPRGINDHGVAVGFTTVTTADNVPMRWSPNGDAFELGRPGGARKAEAVDINNEGVIVGHTGDVRAPLTAVKWTESQFVLG
ncbi:hypothetical protein [Lentzea sp.]|uniref:hypothetical protein n=1 Tax=Lentzea sp. TaxID=56099 RepID=UPI002C59B21E|nr:hypothetical protein [Lentzea sp.]HUQ55177.1 hypothetical protein [Lentzea sp.]